MELAINTQNEPKKETGYSLSPLWEDIFSKELLEEINTNVFLVTCRSGKASQNLLRKFMIQHQYYSQYFTRYLCSLMGNLVDQNDFTLLSHNLLEELTGTDAAKISHVELYKKAMAAINAVPKSYPILKSTQQLINIMFEHCRSDNSLRGLAALCLGAEAIVPLIYGPVLDALRAMKAPDDALHFFKIHVEEDEEHAIVMRKIIDRMIAGNPHGKAEVMAFGEAVIYSRMAMLNEIYQSSVGVDSSVTTLLSERDLACLRNDNMLGSGNFLDRCLSLSSTPTVDFIFTDKPITIASQRNIQQFSLDTLASIRRELAGWYLANGIKTGDVVAVCVQDGIGPFLHYIAITSIGATIALINPAMPSDIGISYIKENGFNKLVTDESSLNHNSLIKSLRNAGDICEILNVSNFNTEVEYNLPSWWPYIPVDTTLLMLSHTSGTTGVPKAVKFEHRQFFMGKRARLGRFVESPDERLLTVLPQSHSSAISHLETAILHGLPTYVLSSQEGESVRKAIKDFSPTTVVAFPKSYVSLLEREVSYAEFPSIRRWFSMGDAAHQSHISRLLAGSPGARFIDAFGSSELGMALFQSVSTADRIAPSRSIGRPVDIVTAKIVDMASGDEMPQGSVGALAVCSPTITSGYWKQNQKTADTWRNGYFLTGDIGYCKDNVFYQIDRVVDVVHTPDGSLYTLQLEETIQTIESVYDVTIIGLNLPYAENGKITLLALILLSKKLTEDVDIVAEKILQLMQEKNGIENSIGEYIVIVVNSFDQIPLGVTGKVLKRRLRDLLPNILEKYKTSREIPKGILAITRYIPTN
ncbi:hypothetical protein CE143_03075 [Photorhabdus luminescens]|uniref:AMP-dependent synthetase/ligase domain-containing protein n=1 Tax=Photorhabdus akhurstii TaxID=171438 RepID=A0ABX8LNT8_9GAMM|nr:AMP-binding protein [Photorhabdus akhurstii]QXF32264.1 hypothetical protein B0X70_03090 [Photorhabdus akhurstii]UJD74056.1 hypothetical protein CE143_03075 [Photorhabdus luminescens]